MRAAQITPGGMYAFGNRSPRTMKPVRVLETVRYWEHPYEDSPVLTPSFPDEPVKAFSRPGDVYRGLLCAVASDPWTVSLVLPSHLPLIHEDAAAQLAEYRRTLPAAAHLCLIAPNRIVRPWDEHLRLLAQETDPQ
jgi:hypothetical protein